MSLSPPAFNVSEAAALAYEHHMPVMLNRINEQMSKRNDEENLIGSNPLSVMLTNHQHHAIFMLNVFNHAFSYSHLSAKQIGADQLTLSVEESIQTANQWWTEQNDMV